MVLYFKLPFSGQISPHPSLYCGYAVLQKKINRFLFNVWASNLAQFFRVHPKGKSWWMDGLLPI